MPKLYKKVVLAGLILTMLILALYVKVYKTWRLHDNTKYKKTSETQTEREKILIIKGRKKDEMPSSGEIVRGLLNKEISWTSPPYTKQLEEGIIISTKHGKIILIGNHSLTTVPPQLHNDFDNRSKKGSNQNALSHLLMEESKIEKTSGYDKRYESRADNLRNNDVYSFEATLSYKRLARVKNKTSLNVFNKIETNFTTDSKEPMKHIRSSTTSRLFNKTEEKLILISVEHWYIPILRQINFRQCKVMTCVLTQNYSNFDQASAVIFNHFEMKVNPPPKLKGQIWIFHTEEPPFYTKVGFHKTWQGLFNYTMSYRRNSDFSDAFGRLQRRKVPLSRDYDRIFYKKRAEVAMFESNCRAPSRRTEYVRMLRQYIKVDVYGKCGDFKCGRRNFYSTGSCNEKISIEYKFYIVFENSICNDYTSEKFYNIFEKNYPIIPVVRGAQNMLEYIPSKLFINTYDFRDPKDLATYLLQLGNDKERYIKFLRTMDEYVSLSHAQIFQESMCKLCSMLHNPIPAAKTVDILRWTWTNQCPYVKTAGIINEKFRKKSN